MGAKKNQTEISESQEKDAHILYLENQVQAYISQTSHIQTRLLSTLDTLDALQVSHNRELAAETHAKERLSNKLDRYIGFVQAAEVEKDDLRDAVVQLVEKVEMSNDYSLWPHSHIRSTCLIEPFTGHPTNNTSEHGSDDEIRTYATAMISSLRAERDLERKAHEQTRQQANYRIIELEAQLARRDAELAACITHADDLLSQSKGQEDKFRRLNDRETRSRSRHDNRHMTKEQAIKVMEATSARNKALELEVQGLFDRLEKARLQKASRALPAKPPTEPGCSHQEHHLQLPPSGLPTTKSQSNLRLSSRHPHLREDGTTIHTPNIVQQPQPIQDLDQHIAALASEVSGFRAERNLLADFVAKEQQAGYHPAKVDRNEFERVLLIEEECIRLADSERKLRTQLEASKNAAIAHETDLQLQIDQLRRQVYNSPSHGHAQLLDLLGDPNGEQPMELATPLHASTILPTNNTLIGNIESPYIDPPSVPLPPSPLSFNSPLLSPISSTPLVQYPRPLQQPQSSRISKEAQIDRIENELLDARRDLEDKDNALNELRAVVDGLRRQAVDRGRGGPEEIDDILLLNNVFH